MTGKEDISELFKFYGIQKRDGQSMVSFYEDLRSQAEKCGGQACYVEQKIRDRLILSDEDLVVEFTEISNPSINDVLAAEEKVEKDRQVWTLILPQLSLLEIAAVFHVSHRLEKVVIQYLEGANSATISGQLIAHYPIDKNGEFYTSIGHVQEVTLNEVEEKDLPNTISIFNSIEILTVVKMSVIEKVDYFPDQLKYLKLIDVQIEGKLLQEWLTYLKKTLFSLHLESVTTSFMQLQLKKIVVSVRFSCPNLRSLTIIGETVEVFVDPKNLRSLNVEAKKLWGFGIEVYNQLETLHFLVPESTSVDLKKFTKLRSLTINHWHGAVPPSLEHLRIIYPQDPKYRPQIEALKELKTVQISYHPQEEEEQDRILNKLNPDCLLELIKCLSLEDRISFAYTHSKLFKLITENCCGKMKINKSNIDLLKKNSNFCKGAAPYIHSLQIRSGCDDLHWIVPLCTSVYHLHLSNVNLNAGFIDSWPRNLKYFFLRSIVFEDVNIQQALGRHFAQMVGLETILTDFNISKDTLLDCFERNKDILHYISCALDGPSTVDWNWEMNAPLPTLQAWRLLNASNYPIKPSQMEAVFSSYGPQLKHLIVDINITGFGEAINGRLLPYLEQLTLIMFVQDGLSLSATDLSGLSSLLKLKRLILRKYSSLKTLKLSDSDVLFLIKSLPELEFLQIDGLHSTLRFQKELEDYINKEGRILLFNSHRF